MSEDYPQYGGYQYGDNALGVVTAGSLSAIIQRTMRQLRLLCASVGSPELSPQEQRQAIDDAYSELRRADEILKAWHTQHRAQREARLYRLYQLLRGRFGRV